MIDERERRRRRLRTDFEYYSKNCLSIRTKEGSVEPFKLNKSQAYIHEQIEKQRKETGKVRVLVLKGRQMGCSTYTEGRFYWKTTYNRGVRAFILAHEKESTNALFEMAKRYHDNCPKLCKPSTGASNAKELLFNELDSGYRVGTAGNDSVGRGTTIQFFHGSECGFWKNTGELTKGILQAVPDVDDTEIILESTANGMGNFFHTKCIDAMRGGTDYRLIFIPWFWQDEYRKTAPSDFELTETEVELKRRYRLDDDQINWRRYKIRDLSAQGVDGLKAFKQEYPCEPLEAFQVTGEDGFIQAGDVLNARNKVIDPVGKLVVGVDPSRGRDRFAVARKKGRVIYGVESYTGDIKLGDAVQICLKILRNEEVHRMYIDAGGGADLADRLHELGWGHVVYPVPFGGKPLDPDKYKNKRAEMWGEVKDFLTDENLEVSIPDDDALQSDLCTPYYKRDSMDRIQLESKDDIKKRGLPSPDLADAVALCFTEPVRDVAARVHRVHRAVGGSKRRHYG